MVVTFNLYFYFTAGITITLDPHSQYLADIEEDIGKLMKCLKRSEMGVREFRCVQLNPPVYVHVFYHAEQISNSSVPMSAWDELAKITSMPPSSQREVLTLNLDLDLYPFFFDNCELLSFRDDALLKRVVDGTETENCRKYHFSSKQIGIGWDEMTWTRRLYWCLKEQEQDLAKMGITVIDLSSDNPTWHTRLTTLFHCPEFCSQFTVFKGVTDIILIGRKHVTLILSTNEEIEHINNKISSGLVTIEISIAKPVMVDCKRNGEQLPSKLSELLSSMYLVGIMSIIEKDLHNVHQVTVFGWLIFRGTFSLGVQLMITNEECSVQVLWHKANVLSTMSEQFHYFLSRISKD